MNKNKVLLISILLLSLLVEGFISGCAKKESNDENSENKSESKKEIPKAINNIEENIKEIFKELKIDKESGEENNNNKEKSQNSNEGSSGSECSEDSKESSSENNENKNKEQNNSNTEDQDDKKWTSIDKKILTLHKNWNSLQPEAIKAGVSREIIDSFSNTLNNLTTECNNKNTENTKMYSIELFGNMANFLDYYKSNPPPDLKRIEYHTMNIKYKSINGNWDNAISDIEKIKSYWSVIKANIEDKKKRQRDEMETAIYELEKAVGQKDPVLVEIKANIVLGIIEDLSLNA